MVLTYSDCSMGRGLIGTNCRRDMLVQETSEVLEYQDPTLIVGYRDCLNIVLFLL